MSTPLQRASSRRNSQLSTGPRTPRGRAAVTANPLTHGFYSRVVLSDFEDPADYHATLGDYLADLRPAGAVEIELVHRYVKDLWKLRRLERLERAFLCHAIEHAERHIGPGVPGVEQRALWAYQDWMADQFGNYKSQAPIERLALLQHRIRRAADTTLRLLTDLQSERLAAPDAASYPFAEISTLPPDTLAYSVDPPPAAADSPTAASPEASAALGSELFASDASPAPVPVGAPSPLNADAPAAGPAPAPSVDADPASPGLPDAPPPLPDSAEIPPASSSIHKPNSTIGFVPPKTESTPPPHPAQRTPKLPYPRAA